MQIKPNDAKNGGGHDRDEEVNDWRMAQRTGRNGDGAVGPVVRIQNGVAAKEKRICLHGEKRQGGDGSC
ncbi:hypothetical protein HRbin30_01207 [bacterium HR30]|nr:hypothetical protein HRbin30_01207 [bacterium HR30]